VVVAEGGHFHSVKPRQFTHPVNGITFLKSMTSGNHLWQGGFNFTEHMFCSDTPAEHIPKLRGKNIRFETVDETWIGAWSARSDTGSHSWFPMTRTSPDVDACHENFVSVACFTSFVTKSASPHARTCPVDPGFFALRNLRLGAVLCSVPSHRSKVHEAWSAAP